MIHLHDSHCVLLGVVALAAITEMQTADSLAPDDWKNFHHVRHFGRRVAQQEQNHEQILRKSFFHCISRQATNEVVLSLPRNGDDSFVSFLFIFMFFPSTNLSNDFLLLTVNSQHRQEEVKPSFPRRRCSELTSCLHNLAFALD